MATQPWHSDLEFASTVVADRPRRAAIHREASSPTMPLDFGWTSSDEVFSGRVLDSNAGPHEWLWRLERLIKELGRITGENCGDFVAPSDRQLTELEAALGVLPPQTRDPEVEIDGSDGSITLRWWIDDDDAAFAITFPGNRRAYGIASAMHEVPPSSWCYDVADETKILDGIDHPLIRKALTGDA